MQNYYAFYTFYELSAATSNMHISLELLSRTIILKRCEWKTR